MCQQPRTFRTSLINLHTYDRSCIIFKKCSILLDPGIREKRGSISSYKSQTPKRVCLTRFVSCGSKVPFLELSFCPHLPPLAMNSVLYDQDSLMISFEMIVKRGIYLVWGGIMAKQSESSAAVPQYINYNWAARLPISRFIHVTDHGASRPGAAFSPGTSSNLDYRLSISTRRIIENVWIDDKNTIQEPKLWSIIFYVSSVGFCSLNAVIIVLTLRIKASSSVPQAFTNVSLLVRWTSQLKSALLCPVA